MASASNIVEQGATPMLDYTSSVFEQAQYDMRFTSTTYSEFFPSSALGPSLSTISITMNATKGAQSYNLNQMFLSLGISITTDDNQIIPDNTEVSVTNNVLWSAIKAIRVYLNNKLVANISEYAYYNYFETLLNYDQTPQETWLTCQGFIKDDPDKASTFDKNSKPYQKRKQFFASVDTSNTKFTNDPITFIGRLLTGINIPMLLPNVEVKIDIDRNDDAFFFLSPSSQTKKFKFHIKSCSLLVATHSLNESLYLKIQEKLKTEDSTMFFQRPQMLPFNIPTGLNSWICDSLNLTTVLPQKVIIGIVDSEAFLGKQSKNGLVFPKGFGSGTSAFYVTKVECFLNNQAIDSFNIDKSSGKAEYLRMFLMTSQIGNQTCAKVTFEEFLKMSYLHVFDFTTSLTDSPFYLNVVRSGRIRVVCHFNKATTRDLIALCYVIHNNKITISKDYKVQVDYVT